MHGWINLDKPLHMSSAHAVDRVKKQLRKVKKDFKIGHAGTLDPLASGVLVLAVGEATKLINYAMDSAKIYEFTATWGEERTTDDAEGEAVQTSDLRPTREAIEAILPAYQGEIMQAPPIFSAIKMEGRRAYDMARAGELPEMLPRPVRVDSLTIKAFDNAQETSFLCHSGKGLYIRSLARDMGRQLGVYGYVSMLRRTGVGKFRENNAISLEKIEEMVHKGDLGFIKPPQSVLDDILAFQLSEAEAGALKRGQAISKPTHLASDILVACLLGETLVAMGRTDASFVKPERVFNILL